MAGADFGEGGGRRDTAPVCESAGAVSSRGQVIIHASQNLDNQSIFFLLYLDSGLLSGCKTFSKPHS